MKGVAVRAESRWPPVVAVLVFVVLNVGLRLWLPSEDVIAVPWLIPSIELVLLGLLVVSDPLGVDRRERWLRRVDSVRSTRVPERAGVRPDPLWGAWHSGDAPALG